MSSKISFNSQLIIAGIIIAAILTISLSETIQIADVFALSAYTYPLIYELDVGETQMLTWGVVNIGDDPIDLEFYATGEGSELFVFEKFVELPAHTVQQFEIFVIVPEDHPDNVEYRPMLSALQRGEAPEGGGSAMIFNVQVNTKPIIKIGDNPIYTEPQTKPVTTIPDPPTIVPETKPIEEDVEETMEEKLARIQAANLEKAKESPIIEQTKSTESVEVIAMDPEPKMDPEPVAESIVKTQVEEKDECDFWQWFLSLFSLSEKC